MASCVGAWFGLLKVSFVCVSIIVLVCWSSHKPLLSESELSQLASDGGCIDTAGDTTSESTAAGKIELTESLLAGSSFANGTKNVFGQQERFQEFGGNQRWSRGRGGSRRGRGSSKPLLDWDNNEQFKHDTFTFARIQYTSAWHKWGQDWAVDMPDSDNNFSFRLQQMTSLKVHHEERGAVVVRLDQPEIFNYPFCYLIEPGRIDLTPREVEGMRKYLNRGGFIMVDDFWGDEEWYRMREQMRRVFPNRKLVELELDHEIFHIVYDLKEKPIIPSIGHYRNGMITEQYDADEPHYWALKDDAGRIMMIICHNTDLGDGWEREGEDEGYFRKYSEPWAYPLGINIVTYALTH